MNEVNIVVLPRDEYDKLIIDRVRLATVADILSRDEFSYGMYSTETAKRVDQILGIEHEEKTD